MPEVQGGSAAKRSHAGFPLLELDDISTPWETGGMHWHGLHEATDRGPAPVKLLGFRLFGFLGYKPDHAYKEPTYLPTVFHHNSQYQPTPNYPF